MDMTSLIAAQAGSKKAEGEAAPAEPVATASPVVEEAPAAPPAPALSLMERLKAAAAKKPEPALSFEEAKAKAEAAAGSAAPGVEAPAPNDEAPVVAGGLERWQDIVNSNPEGKEGEDKPPEEPKEVQLAKAAAEGRSEDVARLLGEGADVNFAGLVTRSNTALILAASWQRAECVKILVNARAGLDLKGEYGGTALMIASIMGSDDIVKHLLDANASLDVKDKYSNTALMAACDQGKPDVIKHFITARAPRNEENKFAKTAKEWGVLRGHDEAMQPLEDPEEQRLKSQPAQLLKDLTNVEDIAHRWTSGYSFEVTPDGCLRVTLEECRSGVLRQDGAWMVATLEAVRPTVGHRVKVLSLEGKAGTIRKDLPLLENPYWVAFEDQRHLSAFFKAPDVAFEAGELPPLSVRFALASRYAPIMVALGADGVLTSSCKTPKDGEDWKDGDWTEGVGGTKVVVEAPKNPELEAKEEDAEADEEDEEEDEPPVNSLMARLQAASAKKGDGTLDFEKTSVKAKDPEAKDAKEEGADVGGKAEAEAKEDMMRSF